MFTEYQMSYQTTEDPTPIWQQVLTWLLFWPLLCLIARQAPYFAGPARAFQKELAVRAGDSAGFHASLYIILLIQALFAAAAKRKILTALKANPSVIAGLVLILISAFWSGSLVSTIHMWIEVSLCTLFACYLTVRITTERLMSLLMFMGVASSLLSIFFVVALPSYGVFAGYSGGAWQGITDHKNTLGLSMAYLLTPIPFAQHCRRWQRLACGALILFMIVMSQSRGAWLYTAGVLGFVGCLHLIRRFRSHESLLVVIVLSLVIAALGIVAVATFNKIAPMMGKDASMSGRTDIYKQVWLSIMKAPILGYGYGGFWGVSPEATRIGLALGWPNINYSESGILELALQLGFVGVGLVLFMVGRAVIQAVRLLRSPFYSPRTGWFFTILFLAALTNIDAGWLLVPDTLDWILILISCIGLEAETRRVRTVQRECTWLLRADQPGRFSSILA
jgi:O-antigen ligase